jgi:hypothetical protein
MLVGRRPYNEENFFMLQGEIAYRQGHHDSAFAHLRQVRSVGRPSIRTMCGVSTGMWSVCTDLVSTLKRRRRRPASIWL